MSQANVLITGCSSGIGRALADAFQAAGYRVWATARKDGDLTGKVSTGGKLDVNALLEAARKTVRPPVRESGWGWDWFEQLAA